MTDSYRMLAQKCSTLQKADRTVDWEIHCRNGMDGVGAYGAHPHYTSSLDAAASLIPDEHDWVLEHVNGGLTIGARVGHNNADRTSWGDTAALALCAAALRAQAELAP